jgi:predicted nucleic acid-binding protein
MLPSEREAFHEEAAMWLDRLMSAEISVVVPDLFWIEIASLMWRAVRHARVIKEDAISSMADLRLRQIETVPSITLVEAAFEIAVSYQRSVYDSMYVALAKDRNTYLITADEKLANAVAAHLPVKWLGAI